MSSKPWIFTYGIILGILISLTSPWVRWGLMGFDKNNRTEVQIRRMERNDGSYVIWAITDAEHWEEDGKSVEKMADKMVGDLGGKHALENTDVKNEEKNIYIRRIELRSQK